MTLFAKGNHGSSPAQRASVEAVPPGGITRPTRPLRRPALNPVETIRPFSCRNRLANRVFDSADAIVDTCCNTWSALLETPHRIASITSRDRPKVTRPGAGHR
jgi:hypothetical protein